MSLVILVYRWSELEKLISKIVRTTFRWQKKYSHFNDYGFKRCDKITIKISESSFVLLHLVVALVRALWAFYGFCELYQ